MAIFRGVGGAGDATQDATNNAVISTAAAAEAASSASAAAASAANALSSETAAATSASTASTGAGTATTQANSATASASSASGSASAASISQTAAALSETNAGTSATTATTQAGIATTQATNASTSASNALTSETNAAASYDAFDDRYLGVKATNPTLDNDGNALLTGALYFNSTVEEMRVYNGASWLTAFSSTDVVVLKTDATGAAVIPTGTTAQRPVSPVAGYTRFNTDLVSAEVYNGTAWGSVGGGATGGVGNAVFYLNDQTVTQDYTIPVGQNASSTGTITVASGVTVTVSAGSRYVII